MSRFRHKTLWGGSGLLAILLSVLLIWLLSGPVVKAVPSVIQFSVEVPIQIGVEITERRSQTSRTQLLDVDLYGLESSSVPIHYLDGEDWVDVDGSFVPSSAPWDWEMTKDGYQIYALDNLSFGQVLKFSFGEESVAFQPMALEWTNDLDQIDSISMPQSVTVSVSEGQIAYLSLGDPTTVGTLEWIDGYGLGRNFKWRATPGRLEKILEIETALVVPPAYIIDGGNPVLRLNFIFDPSPAMEIYIDDTLWNESSTYQTASSVEFRKAGETLWVFMPPRYWDSIGSENSGELLLRNVDGNLYVSVLVPYSWLETATYPVIIDPAVNSGIGVSLDDGYVDQDEPLIRYSTDGYVLIGDWGTVLHSWYMFRGIYIDQSVTITTAYIRTYEEASTSGALTKIWAEDVASPAVPTSWNNYVAKTTTTAGIDWDGDPGAAGFHDSPSIVSVIQELVNSYDYDDGDIQILHMNDGSPASSFQRFGSWDASDWNSSRIHIEYTAPSSGTIVSDPTGFSGSAWTSPTFAFANGSSQAFITSGTPSGSNYWGWYGFSLTGKTITQVRVRYDAWADPSSVTEDEAPTVLVTQTNLTGAVTDIDDDPDSPDGLWLEYITNDVDTVTLVDFDTPSTITTLSGTQTMKVWVRKQPGTGNPDAYVDLYESGSKISTIVTTTSITSSSGQLLTGTFDASVLADPTGADVQTYVYGEAAGGGPSSRATVEIGAIRWYAAGEGAVDDQIRVDVSWDNGGTWSSQQTTTLTSSETAYWYDVTAVTAWTPTKVSNTNLRVRADAYTQGASAEVVYLDWIPVEVTYTASAGIDISNAPDSKAFGVIDPSSTNWSDGAEPSWPLTDPDCYFTVTNNVGTAVDIQAKATNFAGGVGWTLTGGSPGSNTVRMSVFESGDGSGDGLTLTTSDQLFIASLAGSSSKKWELKLETGTFTDGVAKSSTLTLTGTTP